MKLNQLTIKVNYNRLRGSEQKNIEWRSRDGKKFCKIIYIVVLYKRNAVSLKKTQKKI